MKTIHLKRGILLHWEDYVNMAKINALGYDMRNGACQGVSINA